MKFKYLIIFSLFLIIILFLWLKLMFSPVSKEYKNVSFVVEKGSSLTTISNNLKNEGLIRSSIIFKYYSLFTKSQNKIQVGEFELTSSFTMPQILEKLQKNPLEIWVTIPEGLRREEVALKFTKSLNKNSDFTKEFLDLTAGKEGYLYPDTYVFSKTQTAKQIVDKMIATFNKKVGNDVTFQQIIVASLLERETFSESEKPIVAGIIYKRLENDWPLQIDATLQYARDSAKFKTVNVENKYWEPVYTLDKEIKSPFNTYKNLGLPPSPIASAGKSSIDAAINPESSDYWYYIHDLEGKIHFAKTIEEHNQNINKYLN